ncbi:uncharacterized protein LOC144109905 isoform X1 [Amblyomma americanum]
MRYAAIAAAIFNSAMLLFGPTAVEPKQCYKGYCEKVVCKPISASECDGLVVPNASDCACCDYCVKQLGETDSAVLDRGKEERAKEEGEICFSFTQFGLALWGQCKDGLKCNKTVSRCEKKPILPFL